MGALLGRLLASAAAMLSVVVLGTAGYYALGGGSWRLVDCLYMTVITLTTVGYGEILPGLAELPHGRPFTMLLLVLGMGTVVYFASSLTAFIIEGDLRRALRRTRMARNIFKLRDHVVVCGAGSTGRPVIEELVAGGQQVVAVDTQSEHLEALAASLHSPAFHHITGDGTEDEVLAAANVGQARGLVAALPSDKDNLYLVVTARQSNPRMRIVARGSDLRVLDKLRKAGADTVVSPNYIGGMRMVSELVRPHVVRFLDEMLRDRELNIRIEEVAVPAGSPLVGRRLADTNIRRDTDVLVLAALAPGTRRYVYNPGADFTLVPDMTLVVLGPQEQVQALRRLVSPTESAPREAG